ncbi:MAG: SusD/RagB family nutrient-binding outer membrane lipoprotein, partial [Cyclobacteriaceae bacterium]|nr:SusD/RagB family nutrient-binding outer membrane lipoprotein [Cyclobacteriaceae bacterium]
MMNTLKNKFIILVALVLTLVTSCQDLDELNINPNGVDPETADLNLLMATIETGIGQSVVGLGFGNIAGVMQHTQKDGWSGGHNDYDWNNQDHSWSGYYGILRNTDEFYQKAMDGEFEFHQGVALVMKSYAFGMIADLWGDAPYSEALQAEDGPEFFKPAYDGQKDIYMGIFADLEAANTLLSKSQDSYDNISSSQDLLYGGDVSKWRKFANSLALRYYMRLSVKEPGTAQDGINRITSDPAKYPLITNADDDANISYIGASPSDSWPGNTVFDTSPSGSYMRIKLCDTFVQVLKNLNDPRLGVWANKIETPLELVPGSGVDEIVNGVRHISQDIVDDYEAAWSVGVDYDP